MNRYLTLRTKMLVSEFGKRDVMNALEEIEDVDLDTVEREIAACREKRGPAPARRRKSVPELMDQAGVGSDLRPALETVVNDYENRLFLPSLSEVKNFLGERGVNPSKLLSRAAALPEVIRALAHESGESLERLQATASHDRGDLGILADHILGGSKQSAGISADELPRSQQYPSTVSRVD